jgi:hypothetical protein
MLKKLHKLKTLVDQYDENSTSNNMCVTSFITRQRFPKCLNSKFIVDFSRHSVVLGKIFQFTL